MGWWLLMVACVVNEGGPATPGSAAAEAQQALVDLGARTEEIERLATEIEALTDVAREAQPGQPRRDQIEQMRALMAKLDAENTALQADITAIEAKLRADAGDPTLADPEP